MKIFKALGNLIRAKDRETAEALEDGHAVGFAENDLETMRAELQKGIQNKGRIKGTIITYKEEISDKKSQVKNLTTKVKELAEAEKDELAEKVAAKIVQIEQETAVAKAALQQQEGLYAQQEANVEQLQSTIQEAESQLRMMKTMEDVTKSNESISAVNLNGAKSAAERFTERRTRMAGRMNASKAIAEEASAASPGALDREVEKALGNNKAKDRLAEILGKTGD